MHNWSSEKLAKADEAFEGICKDLRGKRQYKAIFAHGRQLAEITTLN